MEPQERVAAGVGDGSMRRLLGPKSLLTDFPDPVARRLIFRASDMKARLLLVLLSEKEYDAGNLEGSAALFHAEMYLSDRLAYELDPPPHKYAIPKGRWPFNGLQIEKIFYDEGDQC